MCIYYHRNLSIIYEVEKDGRYTHKITDGKRNRHAEIGKGRMGKRSWRGRDKGRMRRGKKGEKYVNTFGLYARLSPTYSVYCIDRVSRASCSGDFNYCLLPTYLPCNAVMKNAI